MKYEIQVTAGGPGVSFDYASLGFTLNGQNASATVTKSLYTGGFGGTLVATLTSTNGATASTPPTGLNSINGQTDLFVDEYIDVTEGYISEIKDTFVENNVPEPTALVIWSLLGGVGVAFGWSRRKRAA